MSAELESAFRISGAAPVVVFLTVQAETQDLPRGRLFVAGLQGAHGLLEDFGQGVDDGVLFLEGDAGEVETVLADAIFS